MTPYEEALRRIAEAERTGAEVLDLGDLRLEVLPPELGRLTRLRVLGLGIMSPAREGPDAWVYDNQRVEQPFRQVEALRGLNGLQELDLSGCVNLTALEPLAGLTALRSLSLDFCVGLTALEPLRGLTGLHRLSLKRCAGLTRVDPVGGLAGLQTLSLSHCERLMTVEPLRGLTGLRSLDLSRCPGLTTVEPLRGLTGLQRLNLWCCPGLTTPEPLRGLTALRSLNLSGCVNLTALEPLAGLTALRSLSLDFCVGLTTLEPLRGLTGLHRLNLRHCGHLGPLDPIRPLLPTLAVLHLAGTTFDGLMPEVYGDDVAENVLDKVRHHYDDLARGEEPFAELKVLVLGNGGVGKSHLCNRLLGHEYPADPSAIPSTHGIQVAEFPLPLPGLDRPAHLNLWDFGGQDIYHGSHALFAQRRAVFLILWTPETEAGEFRQGGVTMRHQPLAYWLDYVRHVAGLDAPVLVVQSKCDSRSARRDLPVAPPKDFAFLESAEVSAATGRGLLRLRELIADAAGSLFPGGWSTVGVGRVQMRQQVRGLSRRTLSVEEFGALCRANGNVSDPDALLAFFHECGVLFHNPRLFDGQVILDQNWALEAIYTLLERGKTLPTLLALGGRFTRADLQALVWQGRSDEDCNALIGMMRSCLICFPAGERLLPEGRWQSVHVAPELLPRWSPALVPMFHRLRGDPSFLSFEVRYPFLHDGILRAFLSRIGQFAGDRAVYWKYGCYFHDARTACDVFVDSAWDEATGHLSRGHITVQAWGRDRVAVLRTLHGFIAEHRLAVEPYTRFHGFSGFDDREPGADTALLPSAPAGPTVARQVYLSYAWGDDRTDAGRLREEAARRTIERLTAAGFDVTVDRQDMKPGDLISQFIARIGAARRIVVIVSRKYLESPYCVKELGSIFNHSNRARADFLARVHPIVLPDADLDAVERYAAYWTNYPRQRPAQYAYGGEGSVLPLDDIAHWLIDLPKVLGYLADPIHAGDLDAGIGRVVAALGG